MSNAVVVSTEKPEMQKRIKDMQPGERGYTVPWAYDPKTQNLNEEFSIHNKKEGDTVRLYVFCIRPGEYELSFADVDFKY